MKNKIIIQGTLTKLQPIDLNEDGKISEIEDLTPYREDFGDISTPSETKEALKEINEDVLEEEKLMSTIDFKTNIARSQVSTMTSFDSLGALGFIPRDCLFVTRSYKRNSVSIDRRGRDDMVTVSVGQKQINKEKMSLLDKAKNMFTGKNKEGGNNENKNT